MAPLGVSVTIVEPGGFRTDWAGTSMADYQAIRELRAAVKKKLGYELGDPDRGAKAIVAVAQMEKPPLRLPLGSDAYAYLKLVYESNLAELERTKQLTLSTDFPDATSTVGQLSSMFDRRS
jgi:hypothetical protein